MVSGLVAAVSLFLVNLSALYPRDKGTIAVLPFEITGIDRRLGTIVENTFRGSFVKEKYRVLRKDAQQRILELSNYRDMACGNPVCGIVLGQVLDVENVVIGGILLRGEEIFIHSSLIEVGSGLEKSSAHGILKLSQDIRPYSKEAEKLAYGLMKKSKPGWSKKEIAAVGCLLSAAGAYGYYELTRTKRGDVILIADFPLGGE